MYGILVILVLVMGFCLVKKLLGIAFFIGFLIFIYFKVILSPGFQEFFQQIRNVIQ